MKRYGPRRGGSAAILLYHGIADVAQDPFQTAVKPEDFEAQIRLVADEYDPLSLSGLVDCLRSGTVPRRAVVVTFDDGYANNATIATPILERYGVPATLFLTTDYVGKQREYWWDECERLISARAGATGAAHHAVWERLHRLEPAEIERELDEMRGAAGAVAALPARETHRPASVSELETMVQAGIEIGAHTRGHAALAALPSALAQEEIEGSIAEVERLTGVRPCSFAYPFGASGRDFSPANEEMVREAGMRCALSTQPGRARSNSPRFALPRFFVSAAHSPTFDTWLDSRFRPAARVVRRLRGSGS